MKTYIYNGPPSGVSLSDGREIPLHPGKEVLLDPAHTYTVALLEQGHLEPVVPPEEHEAPKSKRGQA